MRNNDEQLEKSLLSVASTILDSWEDWDAEAQQAAQMEQSDEAYRQVMMDYLTGAMRRGDSSGC